MDIVVPYKITAGEIELKYALRSIAKYLTGYQNIYIVGDKTSFKNVLHIPKSHEYGKEYDTKEKIRLACSIPELSSEFIMWHDDHFLLDYLDVTEIGDWHEGTVEQALSKATRGYKTSCELTMKHTGANHKFFDIHTPMVFNKVTFANVMTYKEELCLKTYYAYQAGLNSKFMADLKINIPYSVKQIESKLKDRLFFSTGPYGLQEGMGEYLEILYPEKSKYES